MRPLQHWLHSRVPRWAWRRGALRVNITQGRRRSFSPWTDLAFLRAGVPLEQVSRHVVVTTDASSTGWGATCNGQAASGLWRGLDCLDINCLELLAVHLALRQFRPLLLGKHVLVRTDNTAAVSYINRMGGIRSSRMSQLARHLFLWSHTRLKTLRAVLIPGELNRAADALSRQLTFPGGMPTSILRWSGWSGVDSGKLSRPVCFPRVLPLASCISPWTEGPLGTDALAHNWPRALCKYAFPPVSLLAQTLCRSGRTRSRSCWSKPFWPTRTWFPELILLATAPSLAHSSEEGPPFSGARHHLAPASRSVEPPCVAAGRDAADLSGLPQAVVETITQARAPSTRQAYALKWSLFANWCSSHWEDPRRCTIGVVFSFLQERLERRLSPSTLKVYVAAYRGPSRCSGRPVPGKHDLIVRFLRGARRLNPSRPPWCPPGTSLSSWLDSEGSLWAAGLSRAEIPVG